MIKRLVLSTGLMILIGSTAALHAAEGTRQYSTGHVANLDYASGSFSLDNGYAFTAEQPSAVSRMWIGEGVLVRYVPNGEGNIAEGVAVAPRILFDPYNESD